MRLKHLVFTYSFSVFAAMVYGQDTTTAIPGDSTHVRQTDSAKPAAIDSAKPTAIDSSQLLKKQERVGKISGQLARNRQKLAELEKDYAQKTADKQKAAAQAEATAEENRKAAIELSNDAANRSKA